MKITVPDDIETYTEDQSDSEPSEKNTKKTFQDEIREVVKLEKIPSKFIVDVSNQNSPDLRLQVLLKFTELCREEIFPRHVKAIDIVETKIDALQYTYVCQQKDLADLKVQRQQLQENIERLRALCMLAQTNHLDLKERMKNTVEQLKNRCNNKTFAEKKMAQDLEKIKKKAEDYNVAITDTHSKMNYYTTQVKAQTNIVKKHVKPLYLDKNKAAFMKTNLNTMRQNIEQLVRRVKCLKNAVSELEEPHYSNIENLPIL